MKFEAVSLANLGLRGPKGKEAYRCVWCDNFNDLQFTDRKVRGLTGWSDPIDDKRSFAEVVCDNNKALVEEKRKRTDEEDNTSKRHNTRNAGKAGQAEPMPRKEIGETSMKTSGSSQPSRMEVNGSMKK